MISFAFYGHLIATVLFLILTILLVTGWRGRLKGFEIIVAVALSALWLGLTAYQTQAAVQGAYIYFSSSFPSLSLIIAELEIAHVVAWLVFVGNLLAAHKEDKQGAKHFVLLNKFLLACALILASFVAYISLSQPSRFLELVFKLEVYSQLLFAVMGLMLIEQLFRNTLPGQRWTIKFLCLGIGTLFIYNLYFYSNALMYSRFDQDLWIARGYVYAFIAPLVAISIARTPLLPVDIFVSRKFVFHSVALIGSGFYLLLIAAGGYYIKIYNSNWGVIAQTILIFAAVIILLVILFSGQMRAWLKFFISKHFYSYKYDYREEWLRFINRLSAEKLDANMPIHVIQAIAAIIESPAGILWSIKEAGIYQPVANWNMSDRVNGCILQNNSLVEFLKNQQSVIEFDIYRNNPVDYQNLKIPKALTDLSRAWIVVPLINQQDLLGFIVFARSRTGASINWEDKNLLLTCGRQAASYLALLEANDALIDARQFEAFNRVSAFVVHDLKNVVAQLALVVNNAKRHRHNPEFINDVVGTVENAVNKMNRTLGQLSKGRREMGHQQRVHLENLLKEVIRLRSVRGPVPILQTDHPSLELIADRERLLVIIEHLVQNAQEATEEKQGSVDIRLSYEDRQAVIEIKDNGCGMDASFIQQRLFRPFDTTKGNAGMGVGVYESREFIIALGGSIDVESWPGQGTKFILRFPAVIQEQQIQARPKRAALYTLRSVKQG